MGYMDRYTQRLFNAQEYHMPYGQYQFYSDNFMSIAYARAKGKKQEEEELQLHPEDNSLVNEENYWIYAPIAHGERMEIHTTDINSIEIWKQHYQAILNIMKDGIYTDYVQSYKIHIIFADNIPVDLCIVDYWMNLIMWYAIVATNTPIISQHLVFEDEFRAGFVKKYFDNFIVDDHRDDLANIEMSNIMSDTLHTFHDLNAFTDYLCNTLNLEDSEDLMIRDPEFFKALHGSYSSLPVDRVDDAIMHDAAVSIERIKAAKSILGYDHCLADAWRANEGINPKQYAEFQIAIGNKPDGKGGIFPVVVDTSFIGGGIADPVNYVIESSTSRIAQIEKHKNVSKSGTLARIMGLSAMDSYLHPDPNYDCHTRHLVPVQVKSAEHLKYLNLRYYRLEPWGQERKINYNRDTHLIGKTILLRSPTTCASAARGNGVCHKCYGGLAKAVLDVETGFGVNIGRIASEFITSKQTQTQLSVKHILKAVISKIEWCPEFHLVFEMDNNVIRANSDIENYNDYRIIINPDMIESDSDYDSGGGDNDDLEEAVSAGDYDEYVTEFQVYQKYLGKTYRITTESDEKLFITRELNAVIKHKAEPTDDSITIPLSALKDKPLFIIKIQNNEISKTMVRLKNLFNRSNEVRGKQIHELLQELQDTNIEGHMDLSSVHYEIILMNMIRSTEDVLEKPNWSEPNPSYRILTLDEALTKNPSVTISQSYQKITKALYTPLTFQKKGASFMDLFFMTRPQEVIRYLEPKQNYETYQREPGVLYEPFIKVDGMDKYTAADPNEQETGKIDFEE